MKPSFKTLLSGVLVTGIVAGLTGCIVVKVTVNGRKKSEGAGVCCGDVSDHRHDDQGKVIPPDPGPSPTPVTGSLAVAINLSLANTNAYNPFPSSQGWDRFYIVMTNFIGKNVTPNAFSFTNKAPKQTTFTVKTCNAHNGAMETGILTYDMFAPGNSSLWVCTTNAGAACADNGNLSIIQRTMANARSYRAVVFYKSSTLGTNQTVKVDFSYP